MTTDSSTTDSLPPTAAPSQTSVKSFPLPEELTARVSEYLDSRKGSASAAVYDPASDTSWSLDEKQFETASVVKLSILEATLVDAQNAKRKLSGSEESLAHRMIATSDNDAATALWKRLGYTPGLSKFLKQVGATGTRVSSSWGLTKTTAADQVRVVKAFAYPNDVLSEDSRAKAVGYLEQVIPAQRWGVSAGPPPGSARLKNGWLAVESGWIVNSVGQVHAEGADYAIAVLSNHGPSEAYARETVEGVARIIWESVEAAANPKPSN